MTSFECRVVDAAGKRTTLRREGEKKESIVRDLNQEGYYILSLVPVSEVTRSRVPRFGSKVILEFTQILMTLAANGLKLKESLSIARRLGGKGVSPLLQEVESRVAKGSSLYDTLTPWKSSFSPLYLGLIRIGEKSGDLSAIFRRLSEYLVGRQAVREKTVNALIYPAFVLAVALLGSVLLVVLVLPGLSGMVSSLNPKAAALYQQNLAQFQITAAFALSVIAALIACLVAAFHYRTRNQAWALRWDSFLLTLPLLRSFQRAFFGFNFAFAMETLLGSGYSVEEALEESSWVVGNRRFQEALRQARTTVTQQGVPLSEALRSQSVFPSVLIDWMAVGEGAQDLVGSFTQVRAFYQKETERLFSGFMSLIEPALIVVVGLVILTLILNFVTPIFTMMGNLL